MKNLIFLSPYGNGGGFDKTEVCGKMVRDFMGPWSPIFCLTKLSNLFIFMISSQLTFQCTRNGPQNLPYCPGSIQDTLIIYSSISHQPIYRTYFAKNKNLENRKSGNLKIPKTRFTHKCPVNSFSLQGPGTCAPGLAPSAPCPSRHLLVNLEKTGFS